MELRGFCVGRGVFFDGNGVDGMVGYRSDDGTTGNLYENEGDRAREAGH